MAYINQISHRYNNYKSSCLTKFNYTFGYQRRLIEILNNNQVTTDYLNVLTLLIDLQHDFCRKILNYEV